MAGPVVVLAGGTGGAKLARGMLDVAGGDLVVLANTGDDVEVHGAFVSPDPDLCTYWLADRIDPRGWGLAGDTFHVMDGLRALGDEVWFDVGDRDLAVGLRRARRLAEGARPTEVAAELAAALGVTTRVLPVADEPVRTWVLARERWMPFQEFMVREHGEGPVQGAEFRGADTARPTPEVRAALASARAIVIGPSNPIISIGPMLAVPGLREALDGSAAAVVAVSPIVAGAVVKGPTHAFMDFTGHDLSAAGIAELYGDLLDGIVTDEEDVFGCPALRMDTLMEDADARRRVAEETLRFAEALAR